MKVKDIMTRNPISIDSEAALGTAIDVMVQKKIRHLPVVDDQETLIGIITDRDLRSAVLTPWLEPYLSERARRRLHGIAAGLENLRVKDAMTCTPITTTPEASVAQAAALMLEHRVGSLPVLTDGALVGIVTDRDAVKALAVDVPAVDRMIEALW